MNQNFDLDYFLKQLTYIIDNYIKTLPINPNPKIDNIKLSKYYIELLTNLREEEQALASNNIENVKVHHHHDSFKSCFYRAGYFEFASNPLLIYYIFNHTLGHELSHLASCYHLTDSPIYLCGFSVHYKNELNNLRLGVAITEGYNELFSSRTYKSFKNNPRSYPTFVIYNRLLETFFEDSRDLKTLYFNCNLPYLIKHLSNYMEKIDAFNTILSMDKLIELQKNNHIIEVHILKLLIYKYLYDCILKSGTKEQLEKISSLIDIHYILETIKFYEKLHINTNLLEYIKEKHYDIDSKSLSLQTISNEITKSKKVPTIL